MPRDDELVALYFSDFFIRNRRTLNTLSLFYDRVFLHDYFGIFGVVVATSKGWIDSTDRRLLDFSWDTAGGLNQDHLTYFKSAADNAFDATVLKGVAQGLGCRTGAFSPTFVIEFARQYGMFLRDNHALFTEDVLGLCQTRQNPHHPIHVFEGGVKLRLDVSPEENLRSLGQARENNVRACIFEETYHSLPLITDNDQTVRRWDRDAELLTTALSEAAIAGVVPTISDVPAAEILRAREKLKDLLPPFRSAIKKAAWDVAAASRCDSRDEVQRLCELYYKTRIKPAIEEIALKLADEDAKLKRKLLERGIDKTVLVAKAIDPTEPLSKWDLIGSGLKSLLDIDESRGAKREARAPYEYLVRLPQAFRALARADQP